MSIFGLRDSSFLAKNIDEQAGEWIISPEKMEERLLKKFGVVLWKINAATIV